MGDSHSTITVSLRETSIMHDFLQNPPSWKVYFGFNSPCQSGWISESFWKVKAQVGVGLRKKLVFAGSF